MGDKNKPKNTDKDEITEIIEVDDAINKPKGEPTGDPVVDLFNTLGTDKEVGK